MWKYPFAAEMEIRAPGKVISFGSLRTEVLDTAVKLDLFSIKEL